MTLKVFLGIEKAEQLNSNVFQAFTLKYMKKIRDWQ